MNTPDDRSCAATDELKYVVEEENRALVRAIGRPARVLDVGCGIGLNGAAARKVGAEVTGLECVPSALAQARTRLHEVLVGDVEDDSSVTQALGERRFDLMLFGDVLEHTRQPLDVLRRMLRFLDDEGRVIISLPNVAAWNIRLSLLWGRFDYQKSGILDDTHLRFFTRKSATQLAADALLDVLSVDQNPMLVRAAKDWILAAQHALTGANGETADPLALANSLPYHAYQALVRPVEDVIANRAPSLMAFQHVVIARKPPVPKKLKLTVGMLTMDEEDSIAPMIAEIRKYAPDAQILCVDSSMHDRTPEIARELGARVLRQVPPRGHGPAMERLMYEAAKHSEALIYLDCDFTYPASYIPVVRALLEDDCYDVVNCARTRRRPKAMPLPNFLANRTFASMAHGLHGVPTVDVHSGMRGYRTSVIRAFNFDGEGDALPIDTLLWPIKSGYRVHERPIDYDERVGPSKLRKVAGTVWTFVRLGRTLSVGRRGQHRFDVA